jgi:IclR family acetate operon transcriptional repressor
MTEPRVVGSDRVLAVLLELAEHPSGVSLDELARHLNSAKPTVHRALASLRRAGLATQTGRGFYELGDDFVRLAFRHHAARPETARIQPLLTDLAERYGETVHFAVLDDHDIVYRAKVDPPAGAVRLTSTIGGRNPARSTAVGKLLLSASIRDAAALDEYLGSAPLTAITEHTITDRAELLAELQRTAERGYGVDNQENEVGVNCIGLPVTLSSGVPGAVSVSGLTYRRSLASLEAEVPAIRAAIRAWSGRD